MATIARLVVEISAKTAEFHQAMDKVVAAGRDTVRAQEATSAAITTLKNRLDSLKAGFRAGVIDENDFARAMRTLKADVAELATQGNFAGGALDRLAKVGQGTARELRFITAEAKRTAEGFEKMGIVTLAASEIAVSGIAGIGRATAAMSPLMLGNPLMIGILAGLSALSMAWTLVGDKTDTAIEAQNRYMGMQRSLLEAHQRSNAAALAALPAAPAAPASVNSIWGPVAAVAARLDPNADIRAQLGLQQAQINEALSALNFQSKMNPRTDSGLRADDLGGITIGSMRKAQSGMISLDAQRETANRLALAKQQAAAMLSMKDRIDESLTSVGNLIDKTHVRIASAAVGIGDVMSGLFSQLGGLLASGHATFAKFLSAIVGTIGGVMVALGKQLIAFGTAGIAIKLFAKNPLGAIAAGAALILLGSQLGGAAQGTVNSGLGGGGGGSFASASAGNLGSGGNSPQTITQTIVFVTQDGREISRHVVESNARQERLGAKPVTVPLNALVIAGPVSRG
jgi:hypothetical protein